jgi:hypothetical protein
MVCDASFQEPLGCGCYLRPHHVDGWMPFDVNIVEAAKHQKTLKKKAPWHLKQLAQDKPLSVSI